MNKFIVHFLGLFTLFISSPAVAWTIEEFNIYADIQANGNVIIEETIKADFTGEIYKHGIFRDIPFEYKDENDKTFKTPIESITVTDANGQPRNFTQSKAGSNISLKIGDPNKTVNQTETYLIKYTVMGVINAFENHDEFYWNVTGNEWDAPINQAKAIVKLPTTFKTNQLKCFTGVAGSTAENCTHQPAESMDTVFFQSTEPLRIGEDLTIVFGWDKGLVTIPERVYSFDFEYWAKRLQYLFLLFPLWATHRNLKIRKALKPTTPIIPLYHPPEGLGIGLIGFFDRNKPHSRDLTAIITQLCVKGLLKINEVKAEGVFSKDSYKFTLLKEPAQPLDKEEAFVYKHLALTVGQTLSLKELTKNQDSIFKYHHYQRLLSQIRLEVSHYFRSSSVNPLKFLGFTFIFFWLFFLSLVFSVLATNVIPVLSLITGIVGLLALPMFGAKGQAIKHDIKGYKLFLSTADKDRINWSEAQNIFETNLPYAIALDLTDKWVTIFADKIQIPEWYGGEKIPNFKVLEQSITTAGAKSIAASTPRSTSSSRGSSGFGGGGSSGGGFGGGGGRSW